MGQIEDSAAGIRLAKTVAIATAEGDNQGALDAINSAEIGPLRWAVGYMGGMVTATFHALADDDHDEALRRLRAACSEDIDIVETQLRLMSRGED